MDDKSASKPVRILISGIWDLFHYGHARAMERAKKMYDNSYLLVGSMYIFVNIKVIS